MQTNYLLFLMISAIIIISSLRITVISINRAVTLILPGSELDIFGIKEAARLLKISLYDLQAHRKSGQLYKGEYLFCNSPLSSEAQFQWRDPSVHTKFTRSSKFTPVWVYDALTLKFIERHDSL